MMTGRLLKDVIIDNFFLTFTVKLSWVERGQEMSARGILCCPPTDPKWIKAQRATPEQVQWVENAYRVAC